MNKATLCAVWLVVALSHSALATLSPPKPFGFEIGNGKKEAVNSSGNYGLTVSDKEEVGYLEMFTEIIAPLTEGTPRARLLIKGVKAENLDSVDEMIGDKIERGWVATNIGGLEGVKREITLPTGLNQFEAQLFRSVGEMILINLEGRQDKAGKSSYARIRTALETFHILN